jgi:hypothetical protein
LYKQGELELFDNVANQFFSENNVSNLNYDAFVQLWNEFKTKRPALFVKPAPSKLLPKQQELTWEELQRLPKLPFRDILRSEVKQEIMDKYLKEMMSEMPEENKDLIPELEERLAKYQQAMEEKKAQAQAEAEEKKREALKSEERAIGEELVGLLQKYVSALRLGTADIRDREALDTNANVYLELVKYLDPNTPADKYDDIKDVFKQGLEQRKWSNVEDTLSSMRNFVIYGMPQPAEFEFEENPEKIKQQREEALQTIQSEAVEKKYADIVNTLADYEQLSKQQKDKLRNDFIFLLDVNDMEYKKKAVKKDLNNLLNTNREQFFKYTVELVNDYRNANKGKVPPRSGEEIKVEVEKVKEEKQIDLIVVSETSSE